MINKRIVLYLNDLVEKKNQLVLELEFILEDGSTGYIKFNKRLTKILKQLTDIENNISQLNNYLLMDNVKQNSKEDE